MVLPLAAAGYYFKDELGDAYDWGKGKYTDEMDRRKARAQLEHGDENRDTARAGYDEAGGRRAPQAGRTQLADASRSNAAQINMGPQEQWRQQQMELAGGLGAQARGEGPSVSGAQFRAANDSNLAQQQALAAGARGGNVAMAGRQAAQNVGAFGQQSAQQAAIGRMQEQRSAQQQLGGLLNQGRTSDIGLASGQATLQQQTNLANQGAANKFALQQGDMDQNLKLANIRAQLAQTGMNDAQQMAYLQQLTGMDAAELAARTSQGDTSILGDVISAGGAVAGWLSDENLKTDIKESSDNSSIEKFLNNLTPYDYKYKDSKHGKGDFTSVMAQDLQKSDVGSKFVVDTEEGLGVDYIRAQPAMLAALAHLNSEVNKLKK